MNPFYRFSLRIPKVHRMTIDAADEIPTLNAATLIPAEYPVAALGEGETCVGADNSCGCRGAYLKR